MSYVTKVDDSNPRKFGDIEFTEQQMEEYKEAFLGTGCLLNFVIVEYLKIYSELSMSGERTEK